LLASPALISRSHRSRSERLATEHDEPLGLLDAVRVLLRVTQRRDVDLVGLLDLASGILALAKVEVDLSTIPEGKNVIIKVRSSLWRFVSSYSGFLTRSESFCGSRSDETSTWLASSISPAVR
jgi:hypothetical protein